jgi:hypothetical protein
VCAQAARAPPPIDFTWEREWRVHAEQLAPDPRACDLIVPDADAEEELRNRHDAEEFTRSELRAQEEPERVNHFEVRRESLRSCS